MVTTESSKQPAPGPFSTTSDKVAVVLGTRPEIIKLAGIIEGLGSRARVIHTGQHYDQGLSGAFFAELGLALPDHQFTVGGARRGGQIAAALDGLDQLFSADPPRAVVVQGDTNATVAGALAANVADVPLVHVEAGLRSYDRAMPEEHNRVIADHLAEVRCAATEDNAANLAREGIVDGVVVTGNTVVEAVARQLPDPDGQGDVLARFGCRPERYVLATIHRPENTDTKDRLATILDALAGCGHEVLVPLHPRTRAAANQHGLDPLLGRLRTIDPLNSTDFLSLAKHAALLVSDSGGIQEECTVLKRPLVVVRNSTERPESLGSFARLVQPDGLAKEVHATLEAGDDLRRELAQIPSPYGDGRASERIVHLIDALVEASGDPIP